MVTKKDIKIAEALLFDQLETKYNLKINEATDVQLYYTLVSITKRLMRQKRAKYYNEKNRTKKVVHYLSIEFLLGRSLKNNLWNLAKEEAFAGALKIHGRSIDRIYAVEKDAGLGNGGLGRLAACFMDALAKCDYPAIGYSIKYEYGLFKQKIVSGKQIETPDDWLDSGNVWLSRRDDIAEEVGFGGTVVEHFDGEKFSCETINEIKVRAVPHDMLIGAYGSSTFSTLRLWEARLEKVFDIAEFDKGNYAEAFAEKVEIEAINKVLYPNDDTVKGKKLRLMQQYFLVSATMQSILRKYFKNHSNLKALPSLVAVHINDTHPALCVPELLRILIDTYGFGWDESWEAIEKIVSYTNHTILAESLEVKNLDMISGLMPRIAMILREIDRRFRGFVLSVSGGNEGLANKLAIIQNGNVFMANLSIYASYKINGVSKIHTNILKTGLFEEFYKLYPSRFENVTNGIAHRRWLCQSNTELDSLICRLIGAKYYDDAEKLKGLAKFENDDNVLKAIEKVKQKNKEKFAKYILETQGITIDPTARFDVQVKRIHEYKRQLLNVLKIIYLAKVLKNNPNAPFTPQVFIFAGKAAAGYAMAKRIINLVYCVANEINSDSDLNGKIKVVFLDNYNVTLAEVLMPATDVTEQISMAGQEASGTGNMKAVINGALMIGTEDGANIEIADACGRENLFMFGHSADEVHEIYKNGYKPQEILAQSQRAQIVISALRDGFYGEKFDDIADYLLGVSTKKDRFLCIADLDSYIDAHYKLDEAYADKKNWFRKTLKCISAMGEFSADRAIEDYSNKIWKLTKNEK